jgi:hypothetical protein
MQTAPVKSHAGYLDNYALTACGGQGPRLASGPRGLNYMPFEVLTSGGAASTMPIFKVLTSLPSSAVFCEQASQHGHGAGQHYG